MMLPSANGNQLPRMAGWLVAGLVLVMAAWMIPVNLKSVTPELLREAGRGSPSVAKFGQQILDSEKLGPAELVLAAARLGDDPGAAALDRGIRDVASRRPEWVAWGGWDPFLEPLFNLKENTGYKESMPVLTFFVTEKARRSLDSYLSNSRSLAVQSVLETRTVEGTTRFIPANRAGGQPLDAVVLLTALLYQGEHLSPSLQRELRGLAEKAIAEKQMGDLESFYLDLLSLGKRLNWVQLCEFLRTTGSTKTVSEYAHLTRLAADNLPVIYTAALFSDSADRVASYLLQYGKTGLQDLQMALAYGQGAVRQLLLYQVPVNRHAGPALTSAAEIGLLYPKLTLIVKYLGFFLGAFCVFRSLERGVIAPRPGEAPFRMTSSVLSIFAAVLLVIAAEPFLLKAAPPSEFKIKFSLPILASVASAAKDAPTTSPTTMDTSTLLSIAFFACLQIGMYTICLLKMRAISRQLVPPLVKLRLMENEENLFDGGLYIGIGGTASALVLQVLGLIQSNLLAAYSSNLFGITCVALIKIVHVRQFKRQLILESQAAGLSTVVPPVNLSAPAAKAT